MDRSSVCADLQKRTFDLLVIGGGATGAGIALDAASRGLDVALIERGDFASGTSSRSTKLIHGGVRYLEKAFKELDMGQYHLVREALAERGTLLRIAPHLTRALPLITPLYHRWEIPYYMAGLKMYEWLAGNHSLHASRYVNRDTALKMCPMLKSERLRGGVLFYDGQFDDARMAIAIVTKASQLGATVGNYISADKPIFADGKSGGKLAGFEVSDRLSDKRFSIRAKIVVNATGPFCDHLRLATDPTAKKILEASSGAHLVLPREFSARESGLLIPKTDDGRVLFLLPWLGHTLVGTTDVPASLTYSPEASDAEVHFILEQLSKYFSVKVTQDHVLAAWAGLRPLVSPTNEGATAQISREHYLEELPSGLVTITGGKWTTYRVMAEETVDFCLKRLPPTNDTAKNKDAHIGFPPSLTANIKLTGAEEFADDTIERLIQDFSWDFLTAKYLTRAYGDRAFQVSEQAVRDGKKLLVEGQPHLRVEVEWAAEQEFACTSADVLTRRLRLGFLDNRAAAKALPSVNEQLAKVGDWSDARKRTDLEEGRAFLRTLECTATLTRSSNEGESR